MSDKKLSQDQLNNLFENVIKDGEEAIEKALNKEDDKYFSDYDFEKPDKFNPENLKSLHQIFVSFGKNFSQMMSASLKMGIDFKITQTIEQIPYTTEYIEKLPKNYAVFGVIDLGRKELGKIIAELDLNLILPIHKKMLGGKKAEIIEERRPLTEIERITLEQWINELMFPNLQEAFRNVVDLKLKISNIETDAQHAKVTAPQDMVALVTFDVFVGDRKSTMRFCIPFMSIEKIIDKLTTENIYDAYKQDENQGEQIELLRSHIARVNKKIDVELGKSKITLKELVDFSEGDVLILDKKMNEDLTAYIDDLPKFSCKMGRKENKVAIKVTGFAKNYYKETAGEKNE